MSFFMRNKGKGIGQKRQRTETKYGKKRDSLDPGASKIKKKKSLFGSEGDDEILSDSDDERTEPKDGKQELYESSSDEDQETAQEKRLRLAKEYLSQLESEEREKDDDDELNNALTERLKKDALERTGRLHKNVADKIQEPTADAVRVLRGHQLPVTCVVITPDDKFVFSAGKDCSIIKWDLLSGKKVKTIPGGRKGTEKKHIGHTSHIHCMAISSDGKFLVTGDQGKNIMAWDPDTYERLHIFTGHRGPVMGVAFRKGTHQLFSASEDRTVKIWNLDEMAYVETLFGHQDSITGVDSLSLDRAITAGGRDHSVRLWKVTDESQLVFHGHSGSIDCVAWIDEDHFISGADDNSIALWSIMKKKPVVLMNNVHTDPEDGVKGAHDNWITAVTALRYSDLAASGCKDGAVRVWKCGTGYRTLSLLFKIPVAGFVNSLQFSSTGEYLVAGVGQEHRLGRWWRIKEAKNGIAIIKLHKT